MKIIDIDNIMGDLTIDSTLITIDSTSITVDKTQYISDYYNIKLVPRVLPVDGDILEVRLRNELTNLELTPLNYFNYVDGWFNLYLKSDEISDESKYEIEILNNGELIYKGKCLSTTRDKEQIQNYTVVEKINNKLKY